MTRSSLCIVCLISCWSSVAAANNMSQFRVSGEAKVVDRGTPKETVIVPITYVHQNEPRKVDFFLHTSTPPHDQLQVLRAAPLVATLKFTATEGKAAKVPIQRSVLNDLGLKPGTRGSLAFVMQGITHQWGTNWTGGGNHADGTSFGVPNSRLRCPARRVHRVAATRALRPRPRP